MYMSQKILTKTVPILILATVVIITVSDFFITYDLLQNSAKVLAQWATIVSAFILLIGIINISHYRFSSLRKKVDTKEKLFSIWFLFLLGLTFILGVINIQDPTFTWLYGNYARWSSTVQSMLAFFIVAAAFRGLRARSKESVLLLIGGILILLSDMPLGGYIWSGFSDIGNWINSYPVNAGQTGLLIGAAFGAILLVLRLISGKERGFLGGD